MVTRVNSTHQEYNRRLPQWIRQRDSVEGEDAIKEKGTVYLPSLDGQFTSPSNVSVKVAEQQQFFTTADAGTISYGSYKNRASFMNATGRTVEGLVGAIMRKDPEVLWPKDRLEELNFIGRRFESLQEVIQETLDEVIGVGRYGLLVDMSPNGGEPYVAMYFAESIIDWEEAVLDDLTTNDMIKGRKMIVRVSLVEKVDQPPDDQGVTTQKERLRILHLGEPQPVTDEEVKLFEEQGREEFLAIFDLTPEDFVEGPLYFQEVWDEVEGDDLAQKQFTRTEVIIPEMPGGKFWREITFTFINPTSTKPMPEKPQLLDLTVVNISHYRNSADLEHGLHFTALPQPWAAGFQFQGEVFIGSTVVWVTNDPQAKAGYLEFSGEGLGTLREIMKVKEKQMAALGARLIEQQPAPGETEAAETVKLRQSGEKSALTKISLTVSAAITNTLRLLALFKALPGADKVGVTLNTDFGVEGLSPQMLTALMQQVQGGTMSWDTYFWNLQRGEMIPEGIDAEAEATRIDAGAPGGSSHEDDVDDEQDDGGESEEEEGDDEGEE